MIRHGAPSLDGNVDLGWLCPHGYVVHANCPAFGRWSTGTYGGKQSTTMEGTTMKRARGREWTPRDQELFRATGQRIRIGAHRGRHIQVKHLELIAICIIVAAVVMAAVAGTMST